MPQSPLQANTTHVPTNATLKTQSNMYSSLFLFCNKQRATNWNHLEIQFAKINIRTTFFLLFARSELDFIRIGKDDFTSTIKRRHHLIERLRFFFFDVDEPKNFFFLNFNQPKSFFNALSEFWCKKLLTRQCNDFEKWKFKNLFLFLILEIEMVNFYKKVKDWNV